MKHVHNGKIFNIWKMSFLNIQYILHLRMAWNDWISHTKFHRATVNVTAPLDVAAVLH